MSSPTKAPVERRHYELASAATGYPPEWVWNEKVAQALASAEAAAYARGLADGAERERAATETLMARHVNGTTFCFCYEGYGEPVRVCVMDSGTSGEGETLVEAWAVECLDAWAITHESPVPQVTRHSDGSGWTCTPVDMMAASIDDYEGATPSMARIAAAQALYAADPSLPPPPKESR